MAMKRLRTSIVLLMLAGWAGCSSISPGKNEYTDAEASAVEAAELAFFADRQLPEGDFPGSSHLLSTALALRCFLEADVTPDHPRHGRTVASGLDFLVRRMERDEPIACEDEAVESRVAVWTLAMAYGETGNPNVLSAVRRGVARLDRWNARTQFSTAHTKFDEYQRMGMESLVLLELRSAGIGCWGSRFAESLETAVRGVDRQDWFNHVAAIRVAFSVHGVDPYESVRDKVSVTSMTTCSIPPREMSLAHYCVLESLYRAHETHFQNPGKLSGRFLQVWRERRMADLKADRAWAINGLRKLDRANEDAIRDVALLVLEMPRPRRGRYFRRPFPKPTVNL